MEDAQETLKDAQKNNISVPPPSADVESLDTINQVADITGSKENRVETLLSLFLGQKEYFVTGVTNKAQGTELMSFLYFNVAPKLQIHSLVLNEKVAGVMWRRFSITQKGTALLAYMEKKRLLSDKI